MKVRVNNYYYFYPVPMDRFNPCYGLEQGLLKEGDRVKVVNKFGCPKANTMNHCYIEKDGQFLGMVCCNSLTKRVQP